MLLVKGAEDGVEVRLVAEGEESEEREARILKHRVRPIAGDTPSVSNWGAMLKSKGLMQRLRCWRTPEPAGRGRMQCSPKGGKGTVAKAGLVSRLGLRDKGSHVVMS